ncbi:MAG: hypothetical protein SAJ12_20905 [Jaaginema sp. PMC 1079.18]|nr:hypothetical protein [Jaaginema sp. PMC 1080.18]MEC4853448.1 hypothetical protein [Jaaginema sp. PMC 1079.18]MEC4868453.1 hypothetical protein [Jaaginema sp. PMC 1078.18]
MKHYNDEWIQDWCQENGWTDCFMEPLNHYWAFPPGAVMPEPIPQTTLRAIKQNRGMCGEERTWAIAAAIATMGAIALGYLTRSPMPLVLAFAFDAITVARLEIDEF